jgi:hypothetical protein
MSIHLAPLANSVTEVDPGAMKSIETDCIGDVSDSCTQSALAMTIFKKNEQRELRKIAVLPTTPGFG